jgi:hypothetical protein
MEKKKIILIIVIALVIVVLIVAGFFWYKNYLKTKNFWANFGGADNLIDNVTKGTLPSINTNPLGSKPDINPVDNSNPIKNIKTNPFE